MSLTRNLRLIIPEFLHSMASRPKFIKFLLYECGLTEN